MPAEFFYPIAGSGLIWSADGMALVGAANKNEAVATGGGRAGPATHSEGTYIRGGGVANTWYYQDGRLDWPGPVGSISALTMGMRSRHANGGNSARNVYFRSGVDGSAGGAVAGIQDALTIFADQGPQDGMAQRPGGGSWTGTDFAEATTGWYATTYSSVTAGRCDICSIWGLLTYEPPKNSFMIILGLMGTSLVGTLADFGHFQSFLSWRRRVHPRHTVLTPEEITMAWDEVRGYRAPSYFIPAVA